MNSIPENSILVKGDLSGIQDFIFNIPSKGASKNLKGRSYYVQMISHLAVHYLIGEWKGATLIYNGGGNFYLHAPDKFQKDISIKQEYFAETLAEKGIFLVLSYIKYDTNENYSKNLENLNAKAQINSLNKYGTMKNFGTFSKVPTKIVDDNYFKEIAEWLIKSADYEIVEIDKKQKWAKEEFNLAFNFINPGREKKITHDSNASVPKWTDALLTLNSKIDEAKKIKPIYEENERPNLDSIIPFEFIGKFSDARNGTDNLGILSLDVDNLGHHVRGLDTLEDNKIFSTTLSNFFSVRLRKLLEDESFKSYQRKLRINDKSKAEKYEVQAETIKFRDVIYVVFAGGDDCFLVGAWDAIFEFIKILREEFKKYVSDNSEKLKRINLTFSAALVLVDSRFPVNQFANLAKDALKEAKLAGKDRLTVFDYVVTWEEWDEIIDLKNKLINEVFEFDAPRNILTRLVNGKKLFEQIEGKTRPRGVLELSVIAQFFYDFREYSPAKTPTTAEAKHRQTFALDLVGIFSKHLTKALLQKNEIDIKNALIFPIAARWADFSTRKIPNDNGNN